MKKATKNISNSKAVNLNINIIGLLNFIYYLLNMKELKHSLK